MTGSIESFGQVVERQREVVAAEIAAQRAIELEKRRVASEKIARSAEGHSRRHARWQKQEQDREAALAKYSPILLQEGQQVSFAARHAHTTRQLFHGWFYLRSGWIIRPISHAGSREYTQLNLARGEASTTSTVTTYSLSGLFLGTTGKLFELDRVNMYRTPIPESYEEQVAILHRSHRMMEAVPDSSERFEFLRTALAQFVVKVGLELN